MKSIALHYGFWASLIFAAVIILASLLAPPAYHIQKNTISDLGSQGYDRKMVMQSGFILFGSIVVFGGLVNVFNGKDAWWVVAPGMVYGFCIFMTGIFCAAPFQGGVDFSPTESNLHSLFAQLAGLAFCVLIVTKFIATDISFYKFAHLAAFCLVIALSALFGLFSEYAGIAQRMLYMVSLLWLSLFY